MILFSLFLLSLPYLSFAQIDNNLFTNTRPAIIILNITNITVGNSATGLTTVSGTIQNNSTYTVDNLKVNVTLFDKNNNVIRDTSRFVSGPFTTYEHNSTDSFSFLMSVQDFDHYSARAFAERIQ